jgi:UDP-N-acetylmuramyl pentapeptide phosphotransferase/UDP-N-acetylglucosamine-1-phosphate transferase
MNQLGSYIPLLAFLTAFAITFFSIPAIIRLSLVKKLYDKPDHRKLHKSRTSALGGISIFGGMLFSFVFYTASIPNPQLNSIIASLMLLFVTGLKDDLFPMMPFKKLGGQILAVLVISIHGNVRIQSLYGMFDVYSMPYFLSILLTVFVFVALINSFNFIDGINGLSAGVGAMVSITFAYWFWKMNEPLFLILALVLAGALLAFLRYNFIQAKIFMGDSGSLVMGFLITILSVYFVQKSEAFTPNIFFNISAVVYVFALLIIPIFDTLRVVFIRIFILKKSPFKPDRNHLHHLLLDLGLSHVQSTSILLSINILFIILAWLLNGIMLPKYQLVLYLAMASSFSLLLHFLKTKK